MTPDLRPTPPHLAQHIARDFAPGEVIGHGWVDETTYAIELADDTTVRHRFGGQCSVRALVAWWMSPAGQAVEKRLLR